MISPAYILLLSLSLFSATGIATPVERIFLTNCGTLYNWQTSIAAYYSNNAEEVEGEQPIAFADFGRVITWEGSLITANLNNGESFSAQLQANAAGEPLNTVVGQVITSQGSSSSIYTPRMYSELIGLIFRSMAV